MYVIKTEAKNLSYAPITDHQTSYLQSKKIQTTQLADPQGWQMKYGTRVRGITA